MDCAKAIKKGLATKIQRLNAVKRLCPDTNKQINIKINRKMHFSKLCKLSFPRESNANSLTGSRSTALITNALLLCIYFLYHYLLFFLRISLTPFL